MSDNHYISILLNLKEKNITFDKILEENFIQGILNNDKQFKRDKVIYESAKSQFDVLEKIFNDKR